MERNMDPVKPRRRYDATQRRAQSRAARRIVLATAGELFAERGYQRTSMKDIAAGAGVSVETVYGYFGTKAGLLKELLDVTVAGDDAPVSVPDRAPIQAVRAAPDGRAKLAHYAAFLASIQARLVPLFLVIRGAAGADQDAADLWAGLGAQRLAGMTMLAEHLAESGVLASGRSVAEARDELWALGAVEVYELLVGQRGWSPERYRDWLVDVWAGRLLAEPG
jgi:TetR/AcrR family transcriptional regulator, regulator of autoinduction and epiphytic fitness